jgi:hypothetical protein
MKKYLCASILPILIVFLSFISPSQEIGQNLFHANDEPTIAAADTISDSEAITVSAPTIVDKSPSKALFPSCVYTLVLKGQPVPFKFISRVSYPTEASGFISVVQHHSNYLS